MPLSNAAEFPPAVNVAIFLAAAAVIWFTGVRLTRTLDAITEKTKLGQVFVGMLLLGVISSLPEVANVSTASLGGNPALAVNNLLGSAAINILLLAVADAIVGPRAVSSIVAKPSTMMMAGLSMIVMILIAIAITLDDVAIGPIGIASVVVGLVCGASMWIAAGHDDRRAWILHRDAEKPAEREDLPPEKASLAALWWRTAALGAAMFASGYTLSQIGDAIAEQAGLESAIVGFAFIGTATSLPELVTVLTALRLGRPEMAFGQVLGSNFINLSLLPLGDALYAGEPLMNVLGPFELVSSLLGAILIGIFLVGLVEHRNRTVFRMGLDSAAVIALFLVGCALLVQISPTD